MQKTIKTRIQHKHDLEYFWSLAKNFVPLHGELIIYDIEVDENGNTLTKLIDGVLVQLLPEGRTEPFTYARAKIGDGIHTVNDLPFITDAIDLSGYATKEDIKDFITEVPAEYVTESELEAKGYLTEHQSLAGYATEAFVTNEIAKAKLEGEDVDLSGYATTEQLNQKADAEHIHDERYYTISEVDNLEFITVNDIDAICGTTVQVATLDNEVKF